MTMILSTIQSRDQIPGFLKHVGLNRRICEVGVWLGKYHWKLIEADPEEIVGVDIFEDCKGSNGEARRKRLIEKFSQIPEIRSIMIKADSREACHQFADGYFDFVYIDADHRYEFVKADIQGWFPKVKAGGILAGHDYAPAPPKRQWGRGVIQAVNELVDSNNLRKRFHVTAEKVDPSWLIWK